jgi:predicted naringenin-chalcone synthase
MGCHGGINGLSAATSWCKANPEKNALLLCAEISSAIYSLDETENSALVNSLFGDGVAAAVLRNSSKLVQNGARVLGFTTHLIPDSLPVLRFDWDDENHRDRFHVGKEAPKTLAAHVEKPLARLLSKHGVGRADIKHWILHSGGTAILDGLEQTLGLGGQAFRHTRDILRDYGNISSGSFLFTYEKLMRANEPKRSDHGVMMTMGPGLTIEMALIRWDA